jgi:hypothetical protein
MMRVWILGAGFSAGLGGPTLNQLLSPLAFDRLQHAYAETWLSESICATCISLLQKGTGEGLWSNAEEYVAALGSCDPKLEADVARLNGGRPQDHCDRDDEESADGFMNRLYCKAIALIAAQCIHFVERSADDLESWLPYDRWVRTLPKEDVLITFNYDEVVEEAFRRNDRTLSVPNQRVGHGLPITPGTQVLLKLHGGVSVRDTILSPPEPNSIANLDRNPAMLAVPGYSKDSDTETDLDGSQRRRRRVER